MLADRAFAGHDWLDGLDRNKVHFTVRGAVNRLITRADGRVVKLARSSAAPRSWALGRSFGPMAGMPSIPNDVAIIGRAMAFTVGALLLERNDEWAVRRARYMTPETIAPMG